MFPILIPRLTKQKKFQEFMWSSSLSSHRRNLIVEILGPSTSVLWGWHSLVLTPMDSGFLFSHPQSLLTFTALCTRSDSRLDLCLIQVLASFCSGLLQALGLILHPLGRCLLCSSSVQTVVFN